ncbi:YfhO family protein [Paenibacillus mesophilus]|uniref:YfhO family protein n=1 Tax=Paenibacillus mesophilus TaxID=2582849 RepID=UPI00110DC590|nr:YfhO family protein [Paenibacillus mesophilus]TMV50791.1 YfhO family protein [Paenibacillus mesophilus]
MDYKQLFLNIFRKNINYQFWILLSAIFLIIVCFFPFLTGEWLFVYKGLGVDSLWEFWPLKDISLEWLRSYDKGGWIWELGLGTNIFSIQPHLFDPFNLILLLFSSENIPVGFLIVAIIKLCLSGILFYFCILGRGYSNKVAALIALIFTFNGYAILWSCLDVQLTVFLLTTGIIYGYERYRRIKKPSVLVFFTALLAAISAYYTWMTAIFMIIYVCLDALTSKTFVIAIRHIMITAAWGFCGVCLAAVSFIPSVLVLLDNPRVSGSILPSLKLATVYEYAAMLLRGMNTWILDPKLIPVSPFSGPLWTSSLLALICLPHLLIKSLRNSVTIASFIVCFFGIIFLNFTIPIFNGFSQGTYRWSWYLIIPILMGTAKVWSHWYLENQLSRKVSLASLGTVIILWFLSLTYIVTEKKFNLFTSENSQMIYSNILVLFILIGIALLIVLQNRLKKNIFVTLVTVIVIWEVGVTSTLTLQSRAPLSSDELSSTYFDGTPEAIKAISDIDNDFYRVDKNYQSVFLDDALIQGYKGVKTYLSSNNPNYFSFSQIMGAKPNYNFIYGFNGRERALTFLGVRYLLSRENTEIPGFQMIKKENDIYIFKNLNPLPLGFIYNKRIIDSEFTKVSTEKKETILLNAAVVQSGLAEQVPIINTELDTDIKTSVDNLKSTSFTLSYIDRNDVYGEVDMDKYGMLFLSIPFDRGWKAWIDNHPADVQNINLGFSGLLLSPGNHKIKLHYTPPGLFAGMVVSILCALILFVRKVYSLRHSKLNQQY